MNDDKIHDAAVLVGSTIIGIQFDEGDLILRMKNRRTWKFYHSQSCCESVYLYDIQGDRLNALFGFPLITSSLDESTDWPEDVGDLDTDDSFTWTTLMLETDFAKVRVRWLGTSNGYYHETIDLEEVKS